MTQIHKMTADNSRNKSKYVSKDLALKHALHLVNSGMLKQALSHIDICLEDQDMFDVSTRMEMRFLRDFIKDIPHNV